MCKLPPHMATQCRSIITTQLDNAQRCGLAGINPWIKLCTCTGNRNSNAKGYTLVFDHRYTRRIYINLQLNDLVCSLMLTQLLQYQIYFWSNSSPNRGWLNAVSLTDQVVGMPHVLWLLWNKYHLPKIHQQYMFVFFTKWYLHPHTHPLCLTPSRVYL